MKSFPSALNESQNMYGSTRSQSYTNTFDIERLKSINLNKSIPVVQKMLDQDNINISNYQEFPYLASIDNPNNISSDSSKYNENVYYENPLQLPSDVIALAKDYDWVYKTRVKSLVNFEKTGDDTGTAQIAHTAVAPSMFNPMFGVSVLGIIRNTPLLNDTEDYELDQNVSDCSIRTLCALSKLPNSPLGQARYKYADFMYCKDLGKVSNNHLITLRKFAHPIGDHIFEMTTPQMCGDSGTYSFKTEGDVGRLIAWFGTDDNKLEDICKYSYHATWKPLESQIEQLPSTADDNTQGIVGLLSNSVNRNYNQAVEAGAAGEHSIWGWLGSKLANGKGLQGIGKNNQLLSNYDNNKVYTPFNTIQSTHIYEGNLIFNHQFTLVFSYKLRAYDNINPRSALLDLIGNILEVTYRRGKFWGGDRKVIGPTQNLSAFDKVNAFVDDAFDKLGSYFSSFDSLSDMFHDLLGKMGSGLSKLANLSVEDLKSAAENLTGMAAEQIKQLDLGSAMSSAAKGLVKNALGRPTLYAWQSLLTGDDVGLWHVTIGNPRNPILSIGNLIIDDASVQHSGPLGIDDFPSEIKVSVTLKHARPRDITDISRMYTKGASTIYHQFAHHDLNEFFGQGNYASISGLKGEDARKNIDNGINEDMKTHSNSKVDINKYPIYDDKNIPNPFLEDDTSIHIMRTNNWSDTMFSMSMQEVA